MPPRAIEDGLDVRAYVLGVDAAKPVVAARLRHEHGDRMRSQEPVDAPPRPRRGLAAHPGVDHPVAPPGLIDLLLAARGVRLGRIEPVAGGEAGAHEED